MFAGRHRLLTVVEGPVLALDVDGEAHVVEPQRPFAFSGDADGRRLRARGPGARAQRDRRPGGVTPYVTVLELGRSSTLPLAADQAAYVVQGGRDGLATGSLVAGPGEVAGRCTVAVVTLERVG